MIDRIVELLGTEADSLLKHECTTITKELLQLPGPDYVDRVLASSDRSNRVLVNLSRLRDHGRLGGVKVRIGLSRDKLLRVISRSKPIEAVI